MNITRSPLTAYSSLFSHCYSLFFFLSFLQFLLFRCSFQVHVRCDFCFASYVLLKNFQTFRRSLTTNMVAMKLMTWRGCRSCDAILFMVKKPSEAKCAVMSNLLICYPHSHFGRPCIFHSVAFLSCCPLDLWFLLVILP